MELVNARSRKTLNLTTLKIDNTVLNYANQHTAYMIDREKLSHENFQWRATNLGLETGALFVGENVARATGTTSFVVNNWMKSAAHRESIEGDFTHTAISVQISPDGFQDYTQIFIKK